MEKSTKNLSEQEKELEAIREKYNNLQVVHRDHVLSAANTEKEYVRILSNLNSLINNKKESIWSLDKHYQLVICNEFFKNSYLAAYNIELKLGVNLVELLSPKLKAIWKPKYDAALSGEKVNFVFNETIQGQEFIFDIYLNPIFTDGLITGVTALSVDITERIKSEQDLRESELRFSQLANATFEGIGISDNDIIIDANDQLSQMLGYSHKELLGKNAMEFVAPESKAIVIKNQFTDLEVPYEHTAIRKDGSRFPVEIRARSVPYKGRMVRVSAIRDITERKIAEKAIEESEKKFRQFVETANEGIMAADREDVVTFLNRRMAEMLGYAAEEILGHKFSSFMFEDDMNDFHEKMMSRKQGIAEIIERKYKRKDGSALWALVSASPIYNSDGVYDGSLGLITDITDRKNASEILRESEERFRSVAESAHDAIITFNSKGMIAGWNRGAIRIFGYQSDEITGYDIGLIIPELNIEKLLNEVENYPSNRKPDVSGKPTEHAGKRKNGDVFPLEMSLAEWESKTGKYFTGIVRDITKRKKAEVALIEAKEKAEESDRLKSSFLANMSHEIRTPMNGIMGFAELLKNPALPEEEKKEYIHIIESSGLRMLNILNDLIDISKIEAGQVSLQVTHCNINNCLEYIHTFFKPEAEKQGLILSLKTSLEDKKANIYTDKDKVNAILTNLVKNAIKFTRKGSIEIGYDLIPGNRTVAFSKNEKTIDPGNLVDPEFLEFYIKDTGLGVSDDLKEIIFERFRQGSESLSRNYEGAGLGLAISKSYVTMLGGSIYIKDNPDTQGSVFYFTIPYHPEKTGQGFIHNVPSSPEEEFSISSRLKVLITEDDLASEKLLTRLVQNFSDDILVARTGAEAVANFKSDPDIDLIFMDIKLPVMDGYEATRRIRQMNKDVVIFAQTAFARSGDMEKALEAGCNDYVSKPISKSAVMKLVKKYFNK